MAERSRRSLHSPATEEPCRRLFLSVVYDREADPEPLRLLERGRDSRPNPLFLSKCSRSVLTSNLSKDIFRI